MPLADHKRRLENVYIIINVNNIPRSESANVIASLTCRLSWLTSSDNNNNNNNNVCEITPRSWSYVTIRNVDNLVIRDDLLLSLLFSPHTVPAAVLVMFVWCKIGNNMQSRKHHLCTPVVAEVDPGFRIPDGSGAGMPYWCRRSDIFSSFWSLPRI